MKRPIPPEIDALMWQLAESDNPVAREEFERRHLVYGPELARRIRMVAELREAGKSGTPRPRFVPRTPKTAPASKWLVAATAGIAAIAVIAIAAVVLEGPSAAPRVTEHPRKISPTVDRSNPAPTPNPGSSPVVPPVDQGPTPEQPDPNSSPPEVKTPDYRKPRDVRLADVPLPDAITLVAANTGLKVEVAPGFETTHVTIDYHDLSPIDTLKAMGEKYGFTVFEQEEGHVLVLPVRANEAPDRRLGP